MPMTPRTKTVLGLVGIALATALVTTAAVWAVMGAKVDHEQSRAEEALARIDELESELGLLTAELESSGASRETEPLTETNTDSATTVEEPAESTVAETDGRQFCFVRAGIWEGATPQLTVDFAQMLDGDEAAAAATAHGEESPPPNDYYIVNDNPQLREFSADPDMTVKVTSTADGGDPAGYSMGFGPWFDALVGMSGGDFVKDRPYWITIKDGTIVSAEEQFLP